MKVYRFDVESCIYLGEDFCEAMEVTHENGITTIPPPDPFVGLVPVFNRKADSWVLVPTDNLRKTVKKHD